MIKNIKIGLGINNIRDNYKDLDQYIKDHPVNYTQKRKFLRTVMK